MFLFPVMGGADSTSCTISLTPSKPSPQLVGELVIWTTTATNCGDAPVYRYKVAFTSENPKFRTTRDFSLANTHSWAPLQEGSYSIMVTVKTSFDSADSTSAVASDEIHSLVTGDQALVTPTLNPLVALYRVPPCDNGSISVKFRPVPFSSTILTT